VGGPRWSQEPSVSAFESPYWYLLDFSLAHLRLRVQRLISIFGQTFWKLLCVCTVFFSGFTHVSTLIDAFLFSNLCSVATRLARDSKESVDQLNQVYGC